MYSDYSFANAIILFGAFQGLLLIAFLFKKKQGNPQAYWFFTLFLFSLAYINLWYGLHFMEIYSIGILPLVAIFYPYEFLLGVGFYFYIKSQKPLKPPTYKKEFYLFIPAIIYGLLELYWSIIAVFEISPRIYRELEDNGIFTVVEYTRFAFNLTLGILAFRYVQKIKQEGKLNPKETRHVQWLSLFSIVFIGYNILSLVSTVTAFFLNIFPLQLFYFTFFTNTIFIYWIGYIGFSRPNILFASISPSSDNQKGEKLQLIEEKLIQIMEVEEQFLHPDFSLSKLALLTEISSKEVSDYINKVHKCNVSEYINKYRVEKVKAILDSKAFENYTLEAISREAGFKSKSSFNSIFKKHTTLTPSQYRNRPQ